MRTFRSLLMMSSLLAALCFCDVAEAAEPLQKYEPLELVFVTLRVAPGEDVSAESRRMALLKTARRLGAHDVVNITSEEKQVCTGKGQAKSCETRSSSRGWRSSM